MDLIRSQCPQHAWYSEEHGSSGDGEYTWVIDPIDGTSNFVRGVPVWATLIGLVHRDRGPVLGLVSAPAMAVRWWGFEGAGAFYNSQPIRVSDFDRLSEASLSITEKADSLPKPGDNSSMVVMIGLLFTMTGLALTSRRRQ